MAEVDGKKKTGKCVENADHGDANFRVFYHFPGVRVAVNLCWPCVEEASKTKWFGFFEPLTVLRLHMSREQIHKAGAMYNPAAFDPPDAIEGE
jgi:hypothetical protein